MKQPGWELGLGKLSILVRLEDLEKVAAEFPRLRHALSSFATLATLA